MAAPTPTEVRTRIEQILTIVEGITTVLDGTEAAVPASDLPAVLVFTGPATRERESRDQRYTTRSYQIVLLVERIDKDRRDATHSGESKNTIQQQQTALIAAEGWLDVVPDFLNRYALRLELDNVPLDGVRSTGEITDSGPELYQWADGVFAAAIWALPVTTQRMQS